MNPLKFKKTIVISYTPCSTEWFSFLDLKLLNNLIKCKREQSDELLFLSYVGYNTMHKYASTIMQVESIGKYGSEYPFEMIEQINNFIERENIEINKIIVLHGPYFHSLNYNIEKSLHENVFSPFCDSHEQKISLLLSTLCNHTRYVEWYQFDPNEKDLSSEYLKCNITKYFFYEYNKFNYSPFYTDKCIGINHEKWKNKEIAFYFSCNIKQRSFFKKQFKDISDLLITSFPDNNKPEMIINLYESKNYKQLYSVYIDNLKKSKYTLIIPSYNKKHFSYLTKIKPPFFLELQW